MVCQKKKSPYLEGEQKALWRMVLPVSVGICLFCKATAAIDSTHIQRNRESTRMTEDACDDTKSLFVEVWSKLLD